MEHDINKSVIVDIPVDLEFDQWSKCWIHKVPRKLRKVKEAAYTPQLVSIGPFHHNKPELQAMQRLKEQYHNKLCKRIRKNTKYVGAHGENDPYAEIEAFIKKASKEIRDRYAGLTFELLESSFEKIILVDACFIVELFLRYDKKDESKDDYILSTPWLKKAIRLDLILLENQLPFFVLENVYGIVQKSISGSIGPNSNYPAPHFFPFLKLACFFFKDHVLTESEYYKKFNNLKIKHFTNLLREFWLPRNFIAQENAMKMRNSNKLIAEEPLSSPPIFADQKYLYSATKLDKAGVAFEPAPKDASLADVNLSKKPFLMLIPGMQLEIPELRLDNDTECLLRNVMALEQCLYLREEYICSYVALMDQLINTGKDVDFLVDKKIISNLLGSDKEAAMLVNGLCDQIPRDTCRFARYFNELNKFYENPWNVTKATLKKVYFKDLWTGSSTIVGIFVLLFTISATTRNVYLR